MAATVLALSAHPDDAEWFAGGLLARLGAEGARVLIAIATDGRRGSFAHAPEALARLRHDEATRAARVLRAEPPIWLGHRDLELERLPPGKLREQFIYLLRQHRPEVVVTGDAACPDLHPDHRAVAWAAAEALAYASLPLVHPEHLAEGLEPHFVREKYFYADDPAHGERVIDITATLEVKLSALAEHASQMHFLVEGVLRQARQAGLEWPMVFGGEPNDPTLAVRYALEDQAAQVGARAGVAYGEAFRYERYHPLVEALLAGGRPRVG